MFEQNGVEILNRVIRYIADPAILVVFSAGLVLFIWGLVQFMWNPEEEARRSTGLRHMIWGMVGMLIMVSVFGIIALIMNTLGVTGGTENTGAGFGGFN